MKKTIKNLGLVAILAVASSGCHIKEERLLKFGEYKGYPARIRQEPRTVCLEDKDGQKGILGAYRLCANERIIGNGFDEISVDLPIDHKLRDYASLKDLEEAYIAVLDQNKGR